MTQKTIILTVILFALIVVGMFVYAKLKTKELEQVRAVFLPFLHDAV